MKVMDRISFQHSGVLAFWTTSGPHGVPSTTSSRIPQHGPVPERRDPVVRISFHYATVTPQKPGKAVVRL